MTRRGVLSLLAVPVATSDEITPDQQRNIAIEFNEHWGIYFRELLGCPEHAVDPETCRPSRGVTDYKSYKQARQNAMKVFSLVERRLPSENTTARLPYSPGGGVS